jgi:hypothetical protein
VRAHGLLRSGAMRNLAAFVAHERPDVLAVCEMPSGDSLSLATRFALQWAYRGRLALFWNETLSANTVRDEQRGFLRVDGTIENESFCIAIARFSRDRRARIPQTRFVRGELRAAPNRAALFAQRVPRRDIFGDLGFEDATPPAGDEERIYVRGFAPSQARVLLATV